MRSEPSGPSEEELRGDGRDLARQCLDQIDLIKNGRERFPPRLFTLWVTPAFAGTDNFRSLLAGIHDLLEVNGIGPKDVPLIGTSVSVVWFNSKVSENGAVLICQASKWISAKVAVAEKAQDDPERAAKELLETVRDGKEAFINPRGNRYLMTYLPGYSIDCVASQSAAPRIIDALNRQTFGRLHLFGGVSAAGISADNFEPRLSSQFVNERVYQGAAVAALVSSDVAYGMGINRGVVPTGESVVVREVSADGLSADRFFEGQAQTVFEKWNADKPFVFASRGSDGQLVVNVPRMFEGQLRLNRPVSANSVLEIARPSGESLQRSVSELEKGILRWFGINRRQVVSVLAIGGIDRYRERYRINFDVEAVLAKAAKRFSNGLRVGCYLDGEIGIDRYGRSVVTNWSLSETLIADVIPPRSEMFLGFDTLAENLANSATAPSVQDATQQALRIIERAGFPGGMISLVYKDGSSNWVRGHGAFGGGWVDVLRLTNRPIDGNDILAIVARQLDLVFVYDAQQDSRCDHDAARKGGLISFAAIPLMNEKREHPVGILQVDLGDLRGQRLSEETRRLLETLGRIVELLLNRAIQAEELAVARLLDPLAEGSLREPSIADAVQLFFAGACDVLRITGYVRLLSEDGHSLSLVAGVGSYYEAAKHCREHVSIDDDISGTARTFRARQDRVVNNAVTDAFAEPLCMSSSNDDPLGIALRNNKAFADYIIRLGQDQQILGVIGFSSAEAWSFTEARLRSLDHIRQRMAHLIVQFRDRDRMMKARQALSGVGAYLAMGFHTMRNYVQELQDSLISLEESEHLLTEAGRQCVLDARGTVNQFKKLFEDARRHGALLVHREAEPCNLESLLQRVIDDCRSLRPDCRFQLVTESAASLTNADESQMAECFRNLIMNGARAAGYDGWVSIRANIEQDTFVVRIQDSGSGLSRATFDAAVKGAFASYKATGSGLGLFMANLFCDVNGCRLELDSEGPQPVVKVTLSPRKQI